MRGHDQDEVRREAYPIGATATLLLLEHDPHPLHARLRTSEPVSWLPVLDGWLVTRHDLAEIVMRDNGTYTVDDPRFSTAQVVGTSMLSLDGPEHARHRGPFAPAFRAASVRDQLAAVVTDEVDRLLGAVEAAGEADLRRRLTGPLAVATMARALGLEEADASDVLAWYEGIVAAVTRITAGQADDGSGAGAFAALRAALEQALDAEPGASLVAAAAATTGEGGLSRPEVVSNAAVLLFGGIETTDGMIANAFWHLLSSPGERALVQSDPGLLPGAVDESLRLEPAAAVVDRYATTDTVLAGAVIARGDLVRVSLAGANRDPAVFPDPDRFDVRRANVRRHLAFAQGPHVCLGLHLARLETRTALSAALARLPGLRLDERRPSAPRGLVFRKPDTLHVLWDTPG